MKLQWRAALLITAFGALSVPQVASAVPETTTTVEATTTTAAPKKVFVCKYVGTPGVDEVLQSGQNPISVSVNAIPLGDPQPGSEFADAQGRSLVLAFDEGQATPTCPAGDDGPDPTTTVAETTTTAATTSTAAVTTTTGASTTTSTPGVPATFAAPGGTTTTAVVSDTTLGGGGSGGTGTTSTTVSDNVLPATGTDGTLLLVTSIILGVLGGFGVLVKNFHWANFITRR